MIIVSLLINKIKFLVNLLAGNGIHPNRNVGPHERNRLTNLTTEFACDRQTPKQGMFKVFK
jgi:hypothetical protein